MPLSSEGRLFGYRLVQASGPDTENAISNVIIVRANNRRRPREGIIIASSRHCHFVLNIKAIRYTIIMPPTSARRDIKMMGGVCLTVRPSVCRLPRPNSRMGRPRKPEIDAMKA